MAAWRAQGWVCAGNATCSALHSQASDKEPLWDRRAGKQRESLSQQSFHSKSFGELSSLNPESSLLSISTSHPISLACDHPMHGALSLPLQRPHLGWCPHLVSPGTREVLVISCGERHWQRSRQNIRAAAPDLWGRPRALCLCNLVEMSKVWRGAWSCCLHHLLEVLERMKPNSPETCTVQGQKATITSCKKGNPRAPWGKTRDRPGRAAQGIVTSFLSCVSA